MGVAHHGLADPDSLTVADFAVKEEGSLPPLYAVEGHRREPPPAAPTELRAWAEAAQTQVQVFALMYGKEHSATRTNALRHLLKEHRDHPDYLSLADLMDVWEELTWRWWEELRRELATMEAELGQPPYAS